MTEEITKLLIQACEKVGITNPLIKLEHPDDISHGDFSSNVAMVHAKALKVNPKVLAEKIVLEFNSLVSASDSKDNILPAEVAGPGFINFKLGQKAITDNTRNVILLKDKFGAQEIGKGKKVLVEYSSPNIAKPFTVGHLRSTIIGDAIANTHSFLGYEVIRDNHLGDWGTQFGKLLFAIEKWEGGSFDRIEKSNDPIKELVDLYVKFHDEVDRFKKEGKETEAVELEELARGRFQVLESRKDPEMLSKWQKCIDLSKKEFNKIYDALGVHFDPKRGDTELGESVFATPEKSNEVLTALNNKKLLTQSEGAQVVIFENEKYPPLMIQKSDGTTIYATRDLATDLYRKNTYGDNLKIINEVGSEQILYFRQLYEIEKMLGWFKESERIHVAHGLYRFKEGKMSTRKGNVIWLKDIIDEAEKKASVINPESAHDVAIGAIKFNDLKRDCAHDIVFDWDEIMNMTGDSGPYLQYSCVRAVTVLLKAKDNNIKVDIDSIRPEIKSMDALERYMMYFPEIIAFSASSYKPNIIANYLINLAAYFNAFYAQTVIVDEKDKTSSYKLAVTEAFVNTMRNGLNLLGIKVPERM